MAIREKYFSIVTPELGTPFSAIHQVLSFLSFHCQVQILFIENAPPPIILAPCTSISAMIIATTSLWTVFCAAAIMFYCRIYLIAYWFLHVLLWKKISALGVSFLGSQDICVLNNKEDTEEEVRSSSLLQSSLGIALRAVEFKKKKKGMSF